MKFLIAFAVVVAWCFGLAWLFASGADNPDAKATADLLYVPCVALAALYAAEPGGISRRAPAASPPDRAGSCA